MAKSKDKQAAGGGARRVANRKAFHDFYIIEKLECGLALIGTEVKSIRAGLAKIDEGYARLQDGELWLIGVNIAQYPNASGLLHTPNAFSGSHRYHMYQKARLSPLRSV